MIFCSITVEIGAKGCKIVVWSLLLTCHLCFAFYMPYHAYFTIVFIYFAKETLLSMIFLSKLLQKLWQCFSSLEGFKSSDIWFFLCDFYFLCSIECRYNTFHIKFIVFTTVFSLSAAAFFYKKTSNACFAVFFCAEKALLTGSLKSQYLFIQCSFPSFYNIDLSFSCL